MCAATAKAQDLKQWRDEYVAADGNNLSFQSPVIKAVDSDPIDSSAVEDAVQRALTSTYVTDGYCNRCLHLFRHWPDLGSKSWNHAVGRAVHTSELEAATRLGCKSCSFLYTQLEESKLLDTFRKIETRLDRLGDGATASLSICSWGHGPAQIIWFNLPGKVTTGNNNACAMPTKFLSNVVQPSDYRGKDADPIDSAIDWFHTCSQDHDTCRSVNQEQRPSRLIAIANDSIRLVLTADWETMPRYATLSYSWGKRDFSKLTVDTLDQFLVQIPANDLPTTFRDAIYVARKLGLGYIWIDALCILQSTSDNTDWLAESGRMRYVYGGSAINIAASSASSVHDSCFSKPANYRRGFLARVETPTACTVRNFYPTEVYEDATTRSHLASRAWALQEKLLAPRTLFLGDRGFFWECRCTIASEFLPSGFPGRVGHQLVRSQDAAWDWGEIVRYYSRADLTVPSDKLPAIAGIARRQGELVGDEYLAGMWRDKLVKQLGWQSVETYPRPDWRAPTWSWASVDGGVAYWSYWNHDNVASTEYVSVVSASTSLAGPDAYGSVTDGQLSLACATLIHARYREIEDVDEDTWYDDVLDDDVWDGLGRDYITLETGDVNVPVTMDCCKDKIIEAGVSIYLLPLFAGTSGMGMNLRRKKSEHSMKDNPEDDGLRAVEDQEHIEEMMIRGIILQRSGLRKGFFQRIGSFNFRTNPTPSEDGSSLLTEDSNRKLKNYNRFLQAMNQVGTETIEKECAEVLPIDTHSDRRFLLILK